MDGITSNIFNSLINFLIKVFYFFAQILSNIIIFPLYKYFVNQFPSLQDYATDLYNYVLDYVLPGVEFCREVFLNVTGYPRPLLTLLVAWFSFKLAFTVMRYPLIFLINVWQFFKGKLDDWKNSPA